MYNTSHYNYLEDIDTMSDIPKAPIKRLVTNNGAVNISADALDKIVENVEEYVRDMGKDLMDITRHSNRKTIKIKDLEYWKQ